MADARRHLVGWKPEPGRGGAEQRHVALAPLVAGQERPIAMRRRRAASRSSQRRRRSRGDSLGFAAGGGGMSSGTIVHPPEADRPHRRRPRGSVEPIGAGPRPRRLPADRVVLAGRGPLFR